MSVPYNLSMYDLLQIPLFKMAAKQNDVRVLESVLWENGLDVTKPYKGVKRLHRALTTNNPINMIRYEGWERSDKDYINSGNCSLDAYVNNSGDASLVRELQSLTPKKSKDFDDDMFLGIDIPEDTEYEVDLNNLEVEDNNVVRGEE